MHNSVADVDFGLNCRPAAAGIIFFASVMPHKLFIPGRSRFGKTFAAFANRSLDTGAAISKSFTGRFSPNFRSFLEPASRSFFRPRQRGG
jgi:hypothetical protein